MNPLEYSLARGRIFLSDLFYELSVRLGRGATMHAARHDIFLPRSRVLKATFHLALSERANQAQIEEWLSFSLGGGTLEGDNPLIDEEIDVVGSVIIEDTGVHQHLEVKGNHSRFTVTKELRLAPYTGPTISDLVCNPNHPAFGPQSEA